MNNKHYTFENCPGIIWRQKELTYPQFETILDNLHGFIKSLSLDNDELIDGIQKLLKNTLPELVASLVHPHAEGFFRRIWNYILVVALRIDVKHPIKYMTLTETAQVVNDFFFLNQQWMKSLNGSAESLGSAMKEALKVAGMGTIAESIGVKSSTFSPEEEPKKQSD